MTDIKGEISEWNEGNFKSMRLHQYQELSNFCSLYPFMVLGKEWAYNLWFKSIVVLFKEGMQKYSGSEYEEVIELKKNTEKKVSEFILCIRNGKVFYNIKSWEELKDFIEMFEYKVKFLNDKHGLSTKNQKYEGLF